MSTSNKSISSLLKKFLFVVSLIFFVFSLFSGTAEEGIKGILTNFPNSLPWLILLALNLIVFKWELLGSLLIMAFSITSVFFFNALENLFVLWWISIPLFLVGLFLLFSSINKRNSSP